MDRRIAPPKDLEATLEKLVASDTNPNPVFQTKQKAMTFAAALGLHRQKRTPIDRRAASTAIRFDVFESQMDDAFVNALAVTETGELNVLHSSRDDERAQIFEEYAHTGLLELQALCFDSGRDAHEVVRELVEDARAEPLDEEDASGVDPGLLRGLLDR